MDVERLAPINNCLPGIHDSRDDLLVPESRWWPEPAVAPKWEHANLTFKMEALLLRQTFPKT